MTGEAKDPHTHVFDGKGHVWFTSQGSNRIGRLNIKTEKVDLITPSETPSNPYGIVLDKDGYPWVALLRTNTVVRVDPAKLTVTPFKQAHEASRSRRIEATPDGMIWYVDETRGYLGRINPATGEAKEWAAPGGPKASPYALTRDDQGRLWFSETGPLKQLVGFDPKTEKFFSVNTVSGNIRHMQFHAPTKTMWFGTDANKIGRIVTHDREVVRPAGRHRHGRGAAALVLSTVAPDAAPRYADGAPPGFSGGFKEQSCDACHFEAEVNTRPGEVTTGRRSGTLRRRPEVPVDRHAVAVRHGAWRLPARRTLRGRDAGGDARARHG